MKKESSKSTGGKLEIPTEAKPIHPPRKTEMSLRCVFTEKELLEIGKKLAEANQQLSAADNEKKQITATLKAKCDSIAARVEQHSGELTSGYTYRQVPCEVTFDDPAKGQKTTRRLDVLEVVSVEAMTLAEMQTELPLGGEVIAAEFNAVMGKIEHPKAGKVDSETGCIVTPGDEGRATAGDFGPEGPFANSTRDGAVVTVRSGSQERTFGRKGQKFEEDAK